MSKIQKALNALQKQKAHKPLPKAKKQVAAAGTSTHTNSAQKPEVGSSANVEEAESTDSHNICVSIDELRASGLHPEQEDIDLVAQQFRRIKRPIIRLAFDDQSVRLENSNVVMIGSAMPKSGKSFCSFNLATSISRERDISAVLVDADVLKPNISRVLGLEDRNGLVDYLLDPEMSINDIQVRTDWYDTLIIPAGRPHRDATELLSSKRMEQFITELSAQHKSKLIVVDTPPLLLTSEAHALTDHCGQLVIVVEAGKSTHESVKHALSLLNKDKPINAILNRVRGRSHALHGDGGYGYGYGSYG